jgi:hypothetical protein
MSGLGDIPVHDATRVRDAGMATEAVSARAGLAPHRGRRAGGHRTGDRPAPRPGPPDRRP